jgi:hypothetical protein
MNLVVWLDILTECMPQLYDYVLTLHEEVRIIWFGSPWTYTKALFILTRYLPALGVFFLLRSEPNHPPRLLTTLTLVRSTFSWATDELMRLGILCNNV